MSHTISKDELKRPDQITAAGQMFLAKLLGKQKVILGAAVVLLLLGGGLVLWDQQNLNNELKLQEDFYVTEKAYLKKKEAFDKAEGNKDIAKLEGDKAAAPKPTAASGDLTKDYGSEVEGWSQLIDKHPSSKAAAMAALELSQVYLKYQKTSEATQILAKVKNHQSSDQLLGAMVFHAYANQLATQGQCQEAIGVWETIESKKKMNFLHEQAQMGRALCLETLGQLEKAESVLKDIVAHKPSSEKQVPTQQKSEIQRTAEKYLRYLQIKKNMTATKAS